MPEWLNEKRSRDFIKALWPIKEMDVSPWAVYAHAAKQSEFFRNVAGWNNFWRMRARSESEPAALTVMENGRPARYMDWSTPDEALIFYMEIVKRQFPAALRCKNCAHCFLHGLKGWPDSDESYVKRLMAVYDFVRQEEEIKADFDLLLEPRKK